MKFENQENKKKKQVLLKNFELFFGPLQPWALSSGTPLPLFRVDPVDAYLIVCLCACMRLHVLVNNPLISHRHDGTQVLITQSINMMPNQI